MKTVTRFVEARWSLVPRLAMAALELAMLQSACMVSRTYAEEPASEWLVFDDNGEPCKATLADGTTLKLDTYGDEYEAYEPRPPVNGYKLESLSGADRGPGVGWGDLALDTKHQKAYWVEGTSKVTHIMSGGINGAGAHPLMDFSELSPVHPTPDPEHGKLYWYTRGLSNGSGRAIYRADLNGKNAKAVIQHITDFSGFTVDVGDEKIYYFDRRRLIRTEMDGEGETVILEDIGGPIAIDRDGGKLYWTNRGSKIRRADLDGSRIEDILDSGSGHIYTIALDLDNQKLYWHNASYDDVCRANLDGTQPETLVVGTSGKTDRIAIDVGRQRLYWMSTNHKQRGRTVGLWSFKLPKPLVAKTRRAPPFVTRISPTICHPGEKLTVTGRYLSKAINVLLLDDGTGESEKAKLVDASDEQLSVILPRMSKRARHPLIVIQSSGGVTVTLPRDTTVIHTGSSGGCDRFHADDKFAYFAEPSSNIGGERAALFASRRCVTGGGPGLGGNTVFLKNGSIGALSTQPNNLIFCEPFAILLNIHKAAEGNRVVPTPAIRPSFVETPFEYAMED